MLFKLKNKTLTEVKEKPAGTEKEIQKLFERDMDKIFRLKVVKSECLIGKKKIDSLVFDPARRAFCIIEYKKEKTISVFDQGVTYLSLLLQNKGELVSEYNEAFPLRPIKRSDVKWHCSKIIFVAPQFTVNQVQAAEFWQAIPLGKEYAIELWEVKQYVPSDIIINPVVQSTPSAREENYVPSEARLLFNKPDQTTALYDEFKQAICSLNKEIIIKPKKREIGFMLKGRVFADISIHQAYLKMWINLKRGALKDPRKITRDVSKLRHWGSGDYEIRVRDSKNLGYVIGLVKQAIT